MRNKGFTLLEIIVVTSIIIILSTVFILNYRTGEKQFALRRSAHQLAQAIRDVEEKAMSSQEFEDGSLDPVFPKGGYGIQIEEGSGSYVMFADCDGDYEYDSEEEGGFSDSCFDAGKTGDPFRNGEKIYEHNLFLEGGVEISSICTAGNKVAIIFFPPDPKVLVNGSEITFNCTITLKNGNLYRNIDIFPSGLIDIQ